MKTVAIVFALVLLSSSAQAQSVIDQSKETTTADAAAKVLVTKNADGTCTQDNKTIPCPAGVTAPPQNSTLVKFCMMYPKAIRCKSTN